MDIGMAAPLTGIRVLDLSRVLAGPMAAQMLADMGAEVIKVERPGVGDETRGYPPFSASGDYSSYFGSFNRGKRSITVNIASPQGQEIIGALAARSDVLIENYKVGSLDRMGLGFSTMSALNPRLIYCSITGFGQTGPHRHRSGYDMVIQAMGGLMSLTGESGREPVKVGTPVADITSALYATSAIMAALFERDRSNKGQQIDIALLDVQIASLANHASSFLMTGNVPQRFGNAHASIVPYQVFDTADTSIVIAVANDLQFASLAAVLNLPEVPKNPKYATNAARVTNRRSLIAMLAARLRGRRAKELIEALDKVGVPCGPINDLNAVFDDDQIKYRDLITEYPADVPIRVVSNPIRFSRTPVIHNAPPPDLGRHTNEVLQDLLGKSEEEIKWLRGCGAI